MSTQPQIPDEGLYVSRKNPQIRLVVTDVDVVADDDDDDDDEIFFLVTVVKDGDEDDMSAPAFEYDPDEWRRLVNSHQLELKS